MKATRLVHCALLGGAIVVLQSCEHSTPLGVARHALSVPLAPVNSVVASLPPPPLLPWCSPLPYDSVTATIGPAGGVLAVGRHAVVFLPNSLDSAMSITAVAPSDTVSRVRLQPSGLTFHQPVLLVLSYATCNLLGSTQSMRVAYTTPDLLQVLDYVPSLTDADSKTVTGHLKHFSDYAVAW
jgi:hypothetical protein